MSRQSRKPKRVIWIGCEGESEVSYVGLLKILIAEKNLPFHLFSANLGSGAGDALARVDLAIRKLDHFKITREKPHKSFMLLDTDQNHATPDRYEMAKAKAVGKQITILWQDPCFEGLILRHLENCSTRRPPDANTANTDLKRQWPEYTKAMSAQQLRKRLDQSSLWQVAQVEPEFRNFFQALGII